MGMRAILIEEIERSAGLVRKDPHGYRPPPRARIIAATDAWMIEVHPLRGEASQENAAKALPAGEWLAERLADFAILNRAQFVAYCVAADLPGAPRMLLAIGINRADGDCTCLGRHLSEGLELGPVSQLPLSAVDGGPLLADRLLSENAEVDEASWQALTNAVEQGLLRFVPEELWLTSKGQVLN